MKLNILFICIIFSLSSFAQRTPLGTVVNIILPKGSIKVTVNELDSLIKNNDEYLRKLKEKVFMNPDSYLIGTMLLQLTCSNSSQPNTLEEMKRDFDHPDDMTSPIDTSEIKSINNYSVLIMHLKGSTFNSSYFFFCVNHSNTKLLSGTLEYDKSNTTNRKEAADILNKILKKITFK